MQLTAIHHIAIIVSDYNRSCVRTLGSDPNVVNLAST